MTANLHWIVLAVYLHYQFFFQKLNHMFLVISVTENKIRIKENESHSKQKVPD